MLWGCQGLTKNPRWQTSPVAPGRSAALPGQSPLAAEVHSGTFLLILSQAIKLGDHRGAFFLSQFVAGLAENNPQNLVSGLGPVNLRL